jgi:hypothetical protein
MHNEFHSSCGGKRRGCCIIDLPHDEQPNVLISFSDFDSSFYLLLGLLAGRPSDRQEVLEPDTEATCLDCEAIG